MRKIRYKEFVLKLDINDGFAIRPAKEAEQDADNPQDLLNGVDGCNLEHGRADYFVGLGELKDIAILLNNTIKEAEGGQHG